MRGGAKLAITKGIELLHLAFSLQMVEMQRMALQGVCEPTFGCESLSQIVTWRGDRGGWSEENLVGDLTVGSMIYLVRYRLITGLRSI